MVNIKLKHFGNFKKLSIIFFTFLFAVNTNIVFAGEIADFIKINSEKVLSIVEKNKSIDSFREKLLTEVNIDELIDFKKISQITLGRDWKNASQEEKERFVKEYRELLYNFYTAAMFNFKNAKIEYKREIITSEESKIKTEVSYLEQGRSKKATVDYVLLKDGEKWKIIDVSIEGISLTMSYKESFKRIISEKGMSGLIEELKQKNMKNKK